MKKQKYIPVENWDELDQAGLTVDDLDDLVEMTEEDFEYDDEESKDED